MSNLKSPSPARYGFIVKRPSWLSLMVLLALAGASTGVIAQSAARAEVDTVSPGWTIPARTVSAPAGVSAELRSAIEAAPAPNVEQRRQMSALTEAQWLSMQKGSSVADLAAVAKQNDVEIERREIEGVVVYDVSPNHPSAEHRDHLFLHVHGGGYVLGGGDSAVTEAAMIAGAIGMKAVSVDYRMPPEHPFPAAIDDAVTVYRKLLESRPAASITIGGTSAGGGLSLATVHRLKALGLDLPGAIWLGTPWADLTRTGDSLSTHEGLDRVLVTYDGMLGGMARLYAGDHDLKDPLLSPLYGDFKGFPATQLVTGTRDMFLSDTARTHRKLRTAGVVADLNVYEGFSHAEYLMVPESPEAQQVFTDLNAFLLEHLP